MRKLSALFGSTALLLLLVAQAPTVRAQEGAPAPDQSEKIKAGAAKVFKALADGNVGDVAQLTARKYVRRLKPEKLRPPTTGPKVKAAFDGNVTVVRADEKNAVVEAKIFQPESSDIPAGEVSRVRVFMVKEEGDWKASAADKKEAKDDSTIKGGWYHAGFFTFCPNRGLIFVSNHFSPDVKCESISQCARF
jgi:hypothetical protein